MYASNLFHKVLVWMKEQMEESSASSTLASNAPSEVKICLPSACCVCGKPLVGRYFQDWEHNTVCEQHKDAICNSCHRFYGPSATEVEPNVFLCHSCHTHLITPQLAERVIGQVRYYYRKQGMAVKSRIRLEVVSVKEMTKRMGEGYKGYVEYPPENGEYLVVVIRHLSVSVFAAVMAHELLHVWQYENNINPPIPICEGFCNLGAYLFMKAIGSPTAQGQLILFQSDTSEVYGAGFKAVKKIFDLEGIRGVLTEMNKYQCIR